MSNLWNRILNTAATPARAVGTVGVGARDSVKTLLNPLKEIWQIGMNTADKVWEVLSNPRKPKNGQKWYQRIVNGILSPLVATGTLAEGTIKAVTEPTLHLFSNAKHTIWNLLVNTWNTINSIASASSVADTCKVIDISTKETTNKNLISTLQRGNKAE